ncbi:AMP-dependent synthetase/ligase [Penicillium cf. griseofulvum]|nr:AMP-dependent synthetase/ligase [Penicillium cf. griseofulvum]
MEIFSEVSAPAVAVASALSVAAGAYLNAKLAISTDLRAIANDKAGLTRLTDRIAALDGSPTIYKMLERAVDLEGRGTAEALWFEHKTWSYSQLKDLADKMAALLKSRDINTGDTVAVFTTNSPEMVVTLYALSKLGAVAAMINTSLRDDTFIHCLGVSGSKLIISTADISQHICADLPHFTYNMGSFEDAEIGSAELVTSETLQQFSPLGIAAAKRTTKDISVLIYTSGTTGKPKACGIRNLLAMITSTPLSIDVNNPKKYQPFRVYSPSLSSTAQPSLSAYARLSGTEVHYASDENSPPPASGKRYMTQAQLASCTSASYVVASGNGLRGEIWEKFRKRFNVPEIREFYRSTEGIAKFDNFGVGAWGAGKIGFAGPIRRFVEDVTFIVKYDTDTDMPYRDPVTGFCVKAALGEEGEAIGRVRDRGTVIEYLGNKGATEEKLLRDVFQKGDLFQRTGDLVVQDESGWVRFQDRVGDTFRWKGVHDAVVYGVKLNGYDGQAGAAGITLESPSVETEFMLNLYKQLKKKGVPSYALPRLVRLTEKVATGVTFKQAKGDLAKKGWDPRQDWGGDVLYWLDGTKYQKLEEQSWAQIESGKAKL